MEGIKNNNFLSDPYKQIYYSVIVNDEVTYNEKRFIKIFRKLVKNKRFFVRGYIR